ncbi:hypothetical protein DFJ58DRAFT_736265 [Suillus subalutaceus]|uniref:uncharacterized protein n=1 Tax=Suillus subalutaceus TaxID=48586 RepID=UPI001B86A389|nr:uncharacterized protein DFJ58DRAFT_736265 [Suillus subalutaceus]KAG1832861.1 hypothetical protein DFJ58DRAFT_736265 [Suillus subalutaceus]
MPTLVAQPDKHPYCTPFPPKQSYKHFQAGSKSTLQATGTYKTTHPIKLASPGLPLQHSTEQCIASMKPSLLGKEHASENKPVAQVPPSADANPLRDVCQQSFVSDRTTPNVRKILDYLSKPTLHVSRKEFHGVGAREFRLIERMVGDTARVSKPRLAYDYNTHILIANMPTVLHEASFNHVMVFVGKFINDLPYDDDVIDPMIQMAWSLKTANGSVVPDMVVTVNAVEEPTRVLIPFVGECALSETDEHIFGKAEDIILAHPEVICMVVVLVREAADYAAPSPDSTASKTLCDPKSLTLEEFLDLRTTPRSIGEPIVMADHTWCHLSSVEYFVWVKRDDGSPINIRSQDPADMAYGTLVPEIAMDAVTEMFERGLTKMKDYFVDFQKRLESSLDCAVLAEARVELHTKWRLAFKRFLNASDVTAHKRYLAWHGGNFGEEGSDSSYVDSEQADEEEKPVTVSTSDRKRASTAPLPCSRFKIQKS